jgi:hypothetical protein
LIQIPQGKEINLYCSMEDLVGGETSYPFSMCQMIFEQNHPIQKGPPFFKTHMNPFVTSA